MGKHICITGALGNLGQKLIRHLLPHPAIARITGIDAWPAASTVIPDLLAQLPSAASPAQLAFCQADLRDWSDAGWRKPMDACDAVVHLAAQVPAPDATWDDAACSLDMTMNTGLAVVASRQCTRLVFATTNHVMGRYKDEPLASAVEPGALRPDLPYGVGTVVNLGPEDSADSTAYAAAKFAGERMYRALAQADAGHGNTEFVSVRIGWCNFGDNHPLSLNPTGVPEAAGTAARMDGMQPEVQAEYRRADRWFKEMWLANGDFACLFERALLADSGHWPGPYICVNGMSGNSGMKWSLAETHDLLGYEPQEDLYRHISPPAAPAPDA